MQLNLKEIIVKIQSRLKTESIPNFLNSRVSSFLQASEPINIKEQSSQWLKIIQDHQKQYNTLLQESVMLMDGLKQIQQEHQTHCEELHMKYQSQIVELRQNIAYDKIIRQKGAIVQDDFRKQFISMQDEINELTRQINYKQNDIKMMVIEQKQILKKYQEQFKEQTSNYQRLFHEQNQEIVALLQGRQQMESKYYSLEYKNLTFKEQNNQLMKQLLDLKIKLKDMNYYIEYFGNKKKVSQNQSEKHGSQQQKLTQSHENDCYGLLKDVINCTDNYSSLNLTQQALKQNEHLNSNTLLASNDRHVNFIDVYSLSNGIYKSQKNKQDKQVKQNHINQFQINAQENLKQCSLKKNNSNNQKKQQQNLIKKQKLNKKDKQNEIKIEKRNKSQNKNKNQNTIINNNIDPYIAFFTLTTQCVKLNSKKFDSIATCNISEQWESVLQKRIPMNKWYEYIKKAIQNKIGYQI